MKATIGKLGKLGKRSILHLAAVLTLLVCALGTGPGSVHAASSRYFPETGKTVNEPFLSYWTGHGGLAQQGYPITEAYNEKNDADGKTYLTQYFERARFEWKRAHFENMRDNSTALGMAHLGRWCQASMWARARTAY